MANIINTPKAGQPIGPYNQAVMAGGTLYVSGQICLDGSTGKLMNKDIETEAHQVMKNLGFILEEAGFGFKNVVKCSIFLADMANFAVVNEIYGSYFGGQYPARETVEVSCLPKNVQVEISLIAVAD